MTHTCFDKTHTAHAKATIVDASNPSPSLALAVLGAFLVLLLSIPTAHATTRDTAQVAGLPKVAPSKAQISKAVLDLRGACRKGVAVFTVKNNAKTWSGRGHLRITDGQTGHVLRERWLRFAEGQSASFHIKPELVESGRFKISVMLPDRSMTYKKSFRGRCTAPTVEAYNARR